MKPDFITKFLNVEKFLADESFIRVSTASHIRVKNYRKIREPDFQMLFFNDMTD